MGAVGTGSSNAELKRKLQMLDAAGEEAGKNGSQEPVVKKTKKVKEGSIVDLGLGSCASGIHV